MLILENIIHWAGVVDELEFAKSILNWCKHGFPELGDTVGRGVRGVLAKVKFLDHNTYTYESFIIFSLVKFCFVFILKNDCFIVG